MVPWSLQLDQYVRITRGLLFCKFNLKGARQLLRLTIVYNDHTPRALCLKCQEVLIWRQMLLLSF